MDHDASAGRHPAAKRYSLRALQVFETIARRGSIAHAAEELGVSQSAISHQLRKLTEEVGERLCTKSGRRIALTETGRRLAGRLQEAFSQIENSVTGVVGQARSSLRLAVCSSFAPGWLIGRLESFHREHPEIDLQLRMYAQDPELTDRVADAFVTSYPSETGFWSLRLLEERLVPVQAPLNASRVIQALRRPLITTDLDPERIGTDWSRYCERARIPLDRLHTGKWLQCSHYVIALEMARQGLGIALVPDFLAARHIAQGTLLQLGPYAMPTGQDYYLCVKSSRSREAGLRILINWFKKQSSAANSTEQTAAFVNRSHVSTT